MRRLIRILLVVGVTVSVAATLATPVSARTDAAPVAAALTWQRPTPANGAMLYAFTGQRLTVRLQVADRIPTAAVRIGPTALLPEGAAFSSFEGNPGTGSLTWKPAGDQVGDHSLTFAAVDNLPEPLTAPTLTVTIRVQPAVERLQLSGGTDNVSRWAYVAKPAVVRAGPNPTTRIVARLPAFTPEGYPNLVLMLEQVLDVKHGNWVHVRLAQLPNGRSGWVNRGYLSTFRRITTHLVVDREALRATLYKDGVEIFSTIVGIGKSHWPTPRGQYYIREKLTSFKNPVYGPVAFGTSARSAVLTDWPGGGYIGIHGTNQPQILPGRVSHGCIRMRNAAILRLALLMPVGTPLTIK